MTNRVYITKSKAGHYTVTMRDENRHYVASEQYIQNIKRAREIAAKMKANA